MNIIDNVKIGGQTYNVTRPSICDEENRNVDGQIKYGQGIIKLQDTLEGEYLEYVFIHEIMHGIFEFCGLKQNENTIDRISRALHMVIKDNPDLFKEGD